MEGDLGVVRPKLADFGAGLGAIRTWLESREAGRATGRTGAGGGPEVGPR